MAAYWRPTAANYLGRITRDQLLALGREILGEPVGAVAASDKKGELAAQLERAFADPEKHGRNAAAARKADALAAGRHGVHRHRRREAEGEEETPGRRHNLNRGRLRPAPFSERNQIMTKYIVHLYREMRLGYDGIEADTPEAAAAIARTMPTGDADDIEDCDGETFSALVDVQGDEDYQRSDTVDFDPERLRKAAPKLLVALKLCHEQLSLWVADTETCDLSPEDEEALRKAADAIAEAETTGIVPEPTAPRLLDALQAVVPYAEAERASLCRAWRHDRDPAVNVELHACDLALGDAAAAIAEAKAIGGRLQSSRNRRPCPARPAAPDRGHLERRGRAGGRPDLTDDQCWEVLQQAERRHDSEIGINWTVLISHADTLLGEADDTDVAGGGIAMDTDIVLFRRFPDGDIIALFPYLPAECLNRLAVPVLHADRPARGGRSPHRLRHATGPAARIRGAQGGAGADRLSPGRPPTVSRAMPMPAARLLSRRFSLPRRRGGTRADRFRRFLLALHLYNRITSKG